MRLGNTSYENFTTNHQTFPTQNERMKTPQLKLDRCCQAFELRIHNAEHPLLFCERQPNLINELLARFWRARWDLVESLE
jgi:hypothetical protein